MNRLFSIRRRRPNIVDLDTPFIDGVDGYRIKWGANFDTASFTDIITSTNVGYIDPAVNRNVIETQPITGKVRIVFNPATYSITDTTSFWLKFVPVTGGSEGTVGAPTLVLPDASHRGTNIVTIKGSAPSASVLQLDLPGVMEDFRIVNEDTTNNLFVGTVAGDPMITIVPKVGVQNIGFRGAQSSLYVQGNSSAVTFSATFTLAFPR
jgi:hypothetical protein